MAEDAFALFRLLHPKFDLVVVGHGQEAGVRDPISPRVVLGKVHTSTAPCIYNCVHIFVLTLYLVGSGTGSAIVFFELVDPDPIRLWTRVFNLHFKFEKVDFVEDRI
jgi:hypothetical protein